MLVLTIKYSSQSIMISIAVIVIFVMFSPTVLLPDMLEHVDVEGGVEGDVGNQLQRLLAHLCLLKKRVEDGNDDVEDEEVRDVVGEVEEPEEVEEREWTSPCGLSTRQYLDIKILRIP